MATRTISLRLEAYERIRRAKRNGESFSDPALAFEMPVVTRNLDAFERVPELEALGYGAVP